MTTYSDWRPLRFINCPTCGSVDTRTRDAPGGLEVDCVSCGARSTLPWTPELRAQFDAALQLARSRHGAAR